MGLVQNHSCQGQSEGTDRVEKMESVGCFRLDRLDSVVNPNATAKLDRMAKQLGFHLPTRVDTALSQDDCGWDDLQMEDHSKANRGSEDRCLIKQSYHPKRSVFSTIMKRLSMPRTKGAQNLVNAHSGELSKIGTPENADTVAQRNSPAPGRFRKWLHRRIWKSKGPLSTRDQSVASLASAEAILEANGFSLLHDEVSRPSCEHSGRLTDRPLRCAQVRNSLLDPEQTRQCASLEELSDHASYLLPSEGPCPPYSTVRQESIDNRLNSGECKFSVISLHIYFCISLKKLCSCSFAEPSVDASQCSVIDDQLHTRMASNLATDSSCGSPHPTTAAFVPSCLVREHSIRSVGDRGKGRVHFLYNSDNEVASSNTVSVLSALSEAKLFQPTKPPPPFLSTHVPSYVGVSVAAFGYSGYGRNSVSSHSLSTSKNSVQPSSNSFSRSQFLDSTVTRGCLSGVQHTPDRLGTRTVCPTVHPKRLTIKTFANKDGSLAGNRPVAGDSIDEPNTSSLGTTSALSNDLSIDRQGLPRPDSSSPCDSPSEIGDSSVSGARLRRPRTRSHTAALDDQEHWQRSSLIMLAVAHASPRPRAVTLSEALPVTPVTETDTSKFFQPELSVTASGLLRTAIGKGRLLISEKFAQFRGLCQQNLDCEAARLRNFPMNIQLDTRVSDLDGFWAMVTLQVDDLHALFDRIEAVRGNNWKPVTQEDTCLSADSRAKVNGQRMKPRTSSAKFISLIFLPIHKLKSVPGSAGQRQRDDSKARLEARKRLEMIKREMRAKKSAADVTGTAQPGIEEESFIAV
ncbi:uncharacterized protein DEA37_0002477 [Paragonimus westermani]|uniref:Disks large-associated protein 1 n=1 Tax=Paragonimus westermani TaxID=34504 RepID=A0A5J4NF37_9TREM|nr:uncharacterized protein DEA37_0002477 [Paragonimus westermani]